MINRIRRIFLLSGPKNFRDISANVRRKLKAKRQKDRGVWFGLGMMGLVGWSIVLPTIVGAGIGLWLDTKHSGSHSWTLILLVAGLSIGCFNAWRWMIKEHHAIDDDETDE